MSKSAIKNHGVRIIKQGNKAHEFDLERIKRVLSIYPDSRKSVHEELISIGLHLKVQGVGAETNTGAGLTYQFDWINQVHSLMPKNVPYPVALMQVGKKVCYITESVLGIDLDEYFSGLRFNWEQEFVLNRKPNYWSHKLGEQLSEAIQTIHTVGMAHGDLNWNNILIRSDDVKVVLIDPLPPRECVKNAGERPQSWEHSSDLRDVRTICDSLKRFDLVSELRRA